MVGQRLTVHRNKFLGSVEGIWPHQGHGGRFGILFEVRRPAPPQSLRRYISGTNGAISSSQPVRVPPKPPPPLSREELERRRWKPNPPPPKVVAKFQSPLPPPPPPGVCEREVQTSETCGFLKKDLEPQSEGMSCLTSKGPTIEVVESEDGLFAMKLWVWQDDAPLPWPRVYRAGGLTRNNKRKFWARSVLLR